MDHFLFSSDVPESFISGLTPFSVCNITLFETPEHKAVHHVGDPEQGWIRNARSGQDQDPNGARGALTKKIITAYVYVYVYVYVLGSKTYLSNSGLERCDAFWLPKRQCYFKLLQANSFMQNKEAVDRAQICLSCTSCFASPRTIKTRSCKKRLKETGKLAGRRGDLRGTSGYVQVFGLKCCPMNEGLDLVFES